MCHFEPFTMYANNVNIPWTTYSYLLYMASLHTHTHIHTRIGNHEGWARVDHVMNNFFIISSHTASIGRYSLQASRTRLLHNICMVWSSPTSYPLFFFLEMNVSSFKCVPLFLSVCMSVCTYVMTTNLDCRGNCEGMIPSYLLCGNTKKNI